MAKVAQSLAKLISQSKKKKTGPYDTQATVKRVEGNTVWVSIPGGVDETPINKTVNCTAGDKVQVRVSGGRAWITGNASAPPTDDKTANEAKTKAVVAEAAAIDAKETAEAVESVAINANTTATNAQHIAEGVNEHFWHDNTGAHVTEVTQEEWNDPADPNYHSGGNTLITTQGMAIRNGLTNLAEFGASGAVIGANDYGESRVTVDNNGIALRWKPADPQYPEQVPFGVDLAGAMSLGESHTVTGSGSAAIGDACEASGEHSAAIGQGAAAVSYNQLAVGEFNKKDTANKYALIVGGGSDAGSRANAFAVARTGNVEMAGSVQSFFKTVDLSWTEPSINAHSYGTNATHTVPSADRPDGMALVGIVGWSCGNYRIYPYVFSVNGDHSISVTMANATTANSASATVHAYLLYIKATSA